MPGKFIDTNVLIYLASNDASKANRAEEIVAERGIISVQVLNEIANVARRRMKFDWSETNQFLDLLRALVEVHPLTVEVHEAGLALAERYGLSIYDAMIVASALQADCETLYSEDRQNGMRIDGRLTIVNPFTA